MSANKKSSMVLLCLSLAVASLLGVFAIIDASSANASQRVVPPPSTNLQPTIIITPTELQASLLPNELLTQTLWFTNTGDSPLTFTIYEITASMQMAGFTLEPVSTPVIAPMAQSQVTTQGDATYIIFLREKPDLSPAYLIPDKAMRTQYVYNRLLETASYSQELFDWLVSQGAKPERLLTGNAIVATLNSAQLGEVALNPQVRQITPNRVFKLIPSSPAPQMSTHMPTVSSTKPDSVEWNIAKIRADEVWSTFGITGEGAVVGIVDTGVMYDHAALVNSYRGNNGDGTFDHNFNWYDFEAGEPVPYDDNGHGSMLTGIISGDGGVDNQIGVAPGADWIAAKACSSGGTCSDYALHAALQWMMAPYDLNGDNADPTKAPDIVIGGWGSQGCDDYFEFDLMVLRAAGILPVFSPGGSGPACNSMGSPGDLPDVLSAGATDQNDNIADFSSRGPSCYGEIKPDVSAPGVDIRSSKNNGSYDVWSGTALSVAHAAGVAALVISANPSLGPDGMEDILYNTGLCREAINCGGEDCPGANNEYGHGRIDAYAAVQAALNSPPQNNLPWLSEAPISATLPAGEGIAINVTFDSTGLEAGTYTGALDILSDDSDQHFIFVPVTLTVTVDCQPISDLVASFTPPYPDVGEVVTFTVSATGTLPISYTWNFDDGSPLIGLEVTHVFDNAGMHVVTLLAENGCGSPMEVELDVPVGVILQRFLIPLVWR